MIGNGNTVDERKWKDKWYGNKINNRDWSSTNEEKTRKKLDTENWVININ